MAPNPAGDDTVRDDAAVARDDDSAAAEREIIALYQAGKRRMQALAARFDPEIQPAGFGILRHVLAGEPIRAGDVANELALDKSAVSRQIAVLREMGLIETKPDPEDGRASLLVSTERARSALADFRSESRADYSRVFESWSGEDIATFAGLLARFNEARK